MKHTFRHALIRWSAALLLISSVGGILFTSARPVLAYSCGTKSTGDHCYALNKWFWQPIDDELQIYPAGYYGAWTDITMGHFRCTADCKKGFITNEMWFADDGNTPACAATFAQACWIEVGYSSIYSWHASAAYFWADARTHPRGLHGFFSHWFGGIPSTDYGHTTHFVIINDECPMRNGGCVWPGSDRTATFEVMIWSYTGNFYHGVSTSNMMAANDIDIGQELAGPDGFSADGSDFTNNLFAVEGLGKDGIVWQYAQNAEGELHVWNPPSGNWSVDPASGSGPQGGDFYTVCSC